MFNGEMDTAGKVSVLCFGKVYIIFQSPPYSKPEMRRVNKQIFLVTLFNFENVLSKIITDFMPLSTIDKQLIFSSLEYTVSNSQNMTF